MAAHGGGRLPNTAATPHPKPECGLPTGAAADQFRPARGPLVPRPHLSPEPLPQLHSGQCGEAPLLPAEVLT